MSAARRARRRQQIRETKAALKLCLERGYVVRLSDGRYKITEAGKQHHDKLERAFGGAA